NWNDYSFYTSYYLHLSPKHTKDGEPSMIGGVKILKKGQKELEGDFINLGYINSLEDDFCSLGQSLDYYQRIAALGDDLKIKILESLNDVIFNPKIRTDFEKEEGF